MPENSTKKPTRKLTVLELSATARGALRRFKKEKGWSHKFAIETALVLLETRERRFQ